MMDFKDLKVWQKAHSMTLITYRAISRFPKEELYGLTSHLGRATASVGANIAEGCGRRSDLKCVASCRLLVARLAKPNTTSCWPEICACCLWKTSGL